MSNLLEKINKCRRSKIILLTQYFHVTSGDAEYNSKRQAEIDECLIRNAQNAFVDEIHLLVEKEYAIDFVPESYREKIKQVVINKRLAYKDAFDYYNSHISNQICVLLNADIYVDDSIELLYSVQFTNTVFALNRYEYTPTLNMLYGLEVDLRNKHKCNYLESYAPCIWSQDAWVWKARQMNIPESDVMLGVVGCDNQIAGLFMKNGWTVINPSRLICINHIDNLSIVSGEYGISKGNVSKHREGRIGDMSTYVFLNNADDIPDRYTFSCKTVTPQHKFSFIQNAVIEKSVVQLQGCRQPSSLFNTTDNWRFGPSDIIEYVFDVRKRICIIDVAGKLITKDDRDIGYVTCFNVIYSTAHGLINKFYNGLTINNSNVIKRIYLDRPIECMSLRIIPFYWKGIPAMKVRLFGLECN